MNTLSEIQETLMFVDSVVKVGPLLRSYTSIIPRLLAASTAATAT